MVVIRVLLVIAVVAAIGMLVFSWLTNLSADLGGMGVHLGG